jgi:hypothetical protein
VGGVLDGFGGDLGGGPVGVGGQVAEHGVETELGVRPSADELDLELTVSGPREELGIDWGCDQAQPVSGGDDVAGADRDGVGGEGVGVELEWGGDVELTGAVEQADADGGVGRRIRELIVARPQAETARRSGIPS